MDFDLGGYRSLGAAFAAETTRASASRSWYGSPRRGTGPRSTAPCGGRPQVTATRTGAGIEAALGEALGVFDEMARRSVELDARRSSFPRASVPASTGSA